MPPVLTGTPVASIYTNPLSGAVGSGADVVIAGGRSQTGGTASAISATYAAEALTSLGQINYSGGTRRNALFGRVSPITGTQSLSLTTADTIRGLGFASYADVNTSDPWGATGTNSGSGTSMTLTLAATTNDLVLIAVSWSTTATLSTPGGTVRYSSSADGHNVRLIELAGDTSVTWTGTLSGSSDWGVSGVVLKGEALAPTITTQPANQTVVLTNGNAASFTVAATASGGSLTYQWQRDTGSGFSDITGATSATLNLSGVVIGDNGYDYRCNVTDANGTTASASANLAVYRGPRIATAFGATNGSGVSTGAIETDFANSLRAGSFIRIVDASGARTSRIGTTP